MICNGYERRLARGKDIQRLILGSYLNAHRKQGAGPVNIEKLVPLVTDRKQHRAELMTAEEYKKRLNLKIQWQAPFKN